jgi:hypothetical protein
MKRLLWLAVLVLGVGMLVAPLAAGTSSATTAKPARAVHTTTGKSSGPVGPSTTFDPRARIVGNSD